MLGKPSRKTLMKNVQEKVQENLQEKVQEKVHEDVRAFGRASLFFGSGIRFDLSLIAGTVFHEHSCDPPKKGSLFRKCSEPSVILILLQPGGEPQLFPPDTPAETSPRIMVSCKKKDTCTPLLCAGVFAFST